MRQIICTLIVLAVPVPLTAGDDEEVRKELKALQGTLKIVAVEAMGKSLPKESIPEFTFTIEADGKSTGKMAKSEYAARITVNPKKDPKTIDNLHLSGEEKGKKQYGVYKLDGDKLTVAMTQPGAAESDRPKDFVTKGAPTVVFVFERIKADKMP